MRIIAGKYKGRKLLSFEGKDIRPTSDRAREALFSSLQDSIANCRFLDGFCGSGAVGIEALSRGALEVVFTDISSASCNLANQNIKLVGESAKAVNADCRVYLKNQDKPFDIIFLDPPYKSNAGLEALTIIGEKKLLTDNGIAVFESEIPVNQPIGGLFINKVKKYGKARITYFNKVDDETCIFAGSFDPVTNGHVNIVKQALTKYKKVIVALGKNENKHYLFDEYARMKMLEAAFDFEGVEVTRFDGMLVDFLKSRRVTANVRGIRNEQDMKYENEMYLINKELYPEINNVYINAQKEFTSISSTAVRDLLEKGLSTQDLIPNAVKEIALEYLKSAK